MPGFAQITIKIELTGREAEELERITRKIREFTRRPPPLTVIETQHLSRWQQAEENFIKAHSVRIESVTSLGIENVRLALERASYAVEVER